MLNLFMLFGMITVFSYVFTSFMTNKSKNIFMRVAKAATLIVMFTVILFSGYVINPAKDIKTGIVIINPSPAIAGSSLATANLISEAMNEYPIEDNVEVIKIKHVVAFDYSKMNMNFHEQAINNKIQDIKLQDMSNEEKIIAIGTLIAEEGNITYEMGSNIRAWNNEIIKKEFSKPGTYYKDNITMDCSTFVQYLVWISTCEYIEGDEDNPTGILLGRGTYFQSIEGTPLEEPEPGCLCFKFNGGSEVIREGDELLKNETPTEEINHVAVYLGDGKFLDCSSAANSVRIIDSNENKYYKTFFTRFRKLPEAPYETTLEQQWHEILEK